MFLNAAIDIGAVSPANIEQVLANSTMDEVNDFDDALNQADSAFAFSDPRRQYARTLREYTVPKITQFRRDWDAAVARHHVSYAQAKADPSIRAEWDPVAAARMLDPRYSSAQKAQDVQAAQELHIEGAAATAQPLYVAQHEPVVSVITPKVSPSTSAPMVKPATIPQVSNTEVNPVFQAGFVADSGQTPPGAQTMLPASDGGSGGSGLIKFAAIAALAYFGL